MEWRVMAVVTLVGMVFGGGLPPPCPSEVFCTGRLLHEVQMAHIFPDSKTFVDMKLRRPPAETLQLFDRLLAATGDHPSRDQLAQFVEENFEPPGSEFEAWVPEDWREHPKILDKIKDPALRSWAKELNDLWRLLGRQMRAEVRAAPELYSFIPVSHPVVVPGGRFREFYYWDSYWIVKGLLISEMTSTVRGMLSNFLDIVEEYGFVPNGGRRYYGMRSQPPLLIPMVETYYQHTGDAQFLTRSMRVLEKEFQFWTDNRTVQVEKDGRTYTLGLYKDASSGPRPESYREDIESAAFFQTEEQKEDFYRELKSAAESGWDFSSRWFKDPAANLTSLGITSLLPADLNSILCGNARILSRLFGALNLTSKAAHYTQVWRDWRDAVEAVHWNPEVGAWHDAVLPSLEQRHGFSASNLLPLWSQCYDEKAGGWAERGAKALSYLAAEGRDSWGPGGVATTLVKSGEQWDWPNAWPPLQAALIKGLGSSPYPGAKEAAAQLAQTWIASNHKAFVLSGGAMYEKYDASILGGHGGGGEYEVQLGFGWSNGVVLELLEEYGDVLEAGEGWSAEALEPPEAAARGGTSSASTGALTLWLAGLATLAAGFLGYVLHSRRHRLHLLQHSYTKIRSSPRSPLY